MRPLHLELQGFLSYRDKVSIDFSGIRAGVILGENGAGKSSIVEAMSWALFGKGRGRGPDDFINAGASFGRVGLVFEHSGCRYRVARQRDRDKGGKSDLSLEVDTNDFDGFGWQPVGGETIAETQAKIEELLGLNYETWLDTSLIGQGKADAFTMLGPADRKRVLFDILQLGDYEARATAARDLGKVAAGRMAELDRRVEALRGALSDEDEAIKRLAYLQSEEEATLRSGQIADVELQEARSEAAAAKSAVEGLTERRAELLELRSVRALERSNLESDLARTKSMIARLEAEISDVSKELSSIEAKSSSAEEAGQEALRLFNTAKELRTKALEHHDAASSDAMRASNFRDTARQLRTSLAEIEDQVLTLERLDDATCPTCGQDLPTEQREYVLGILRANAGERRQAIYDAERSSSDCLAKSSENREVAGKLEGQAAAADAAGRAIQAEVERIAAEEERAPGLHDWINEAKMRLVGLRGEPPPLIARLAALDVASDRETKLESAIAEGLRHESHLSALNAAVAVATGRFEEARRSHERAIAAAARMKAEADSFAALHEEHKARISELETANQEAEELALIADGWGRDGVPALLLEHTIPELEAESNRILEVLTDGRFTVTFPTVAAKKTGGYKETLEILVADALSARSLEALSGGERQCVDLSIRIALGELLARRHDRPIDALIIDEAFTELDPAHLRRTVEAFHALLDRFQMVLAVTHLEDLAEAFPTRILVTREGGSSRVQIEGAA